jgi:chromosomal replication initiation ATPase DnaA
MESVPEDDPAGTAGRLHAVADDALDTAAQVRDEARRLRAQAEATRARLAQVDCTPASELKRVLDELRSRLESAEATITHLQEALHTNRRIGVAMGILMARLHLTHDQAWEFLRQQSQRSNRKLRDLADEIVYTGTLDGAGAAMDGDGRVGHPGPRA